MCAAKAHRLCQKEIKAAQDMTNTRLLSVTEVSRNIMSEMALKQSLTEREFSPNPENS